MKISPRDLIWVNLGLLALAAYWGAATVSAAIAARLTTSPELHLSQPPPPLVREARRPQTYYASISQRDVFNSIKQEVEKPPEAPKIVVECKSKLWGVAVHGDGSSYCIIEEPSTHKQELYGINDKTANCGTVKQVEWDRVILDHDGQEEVLELATAQGAPGRGPGVAPAAALSNQPAANPHIQQVSETEYNIDRSEVDQALDNMNQLFTQIRAVPHFEGGQSTGFRLFAIRQNSIFDQIGLHNGDIIQSVNGMELSDPSKAMGMLGQLRDANQLTVQVLRNKTNMTVSYRIR
jgi:type II secretion system protein C